MWTTLAEKHPEGICVIWRPHGYGPLRKLLEPLAEMFNRTVRSQDKLLLLPVYDAGGTTDRSINSDALAAKLGLPPKMTPNAMLGALNILVTVEELYEIMSPTA